MVFIHNNVGFFENSSCFRGVVAILYCYKNSKALRITIFASDKSDIVNRKSGTPAIINDKTDLHWNRSSGFAFNDLFPDDPVFQFNFQNIDPAR